MDRLKKKERDERTEGKRKEGGKSYGKEEDWWVGENERKDEWGR